MVDVSDIVVHVHANNWDAFARPWSGDHKCRVEIPVYLEVNVDSNLVDSLRFGRALPRWDSGR